MGREMDCVVAFVLTAHARVVDVMYSNVFNVTKVRSEAEAEAQRARRAAKSISAALGDDFSCAMARRLSLWQ